MLIQLHFSIQSNPDTNHPSSHPKCKYRAFTRSIPANQEAIAKMNLKPTLTTLSTKKKKLANIAAIMNTITVVVKVSRRVGHTILLASDLTCCTKLSGFIILFPNRIK